MEKSIHEKLVDSEIKIIVRELIVELWKSQKIYDWVVLVY